MAAYLMSERTAAFVRAQMARQGAVPDGTAGATRRSRPSFVRGSDYAAPFAVRWAASVGEEGAWIIWLPSDSLLVVDGAAVDVREGLEAAGGDYPEGWYALDVLPEEGGTLYLNVTVPKTPDAETSDEGETGDEETNGVTAAFAAEAGESSDEATVWPILIAECGKGHPTKASVDSALVFGTGEGAARDCVTSLNEATGDMAVIGGVGIVVTTDGRTITITADAEKTDADEDPNGDDSDCDHPGNETPGGGIGGGGPQGAGDEEPGGSGGGCSNCGDSATVGGSGGGTPEKGADGKPAGSGTGTAQPSAPNGKEATSAPSTSGGGASSGGTSSGAANGKESPGLWGMKPTKSPIYSGTHKGLTDTKKMNESPFKKSGRAKTIEDVQGDTKKPIANTKTIYGGTHKGLTDTKKMNQSPFKTSKK